MNDGEKAFIQELLEWKDNLQIKINRLSTEDQKSSRSRYRITEDSSVYEELYDAKKSLYILNAVLKKARNHMKFRVINVIQEEE